MAENPRKSSEKIKTFRINCFLRTLIIDDETQRLACAQRQTLPIKTNSSAFYPMELHQGCAACCLRLPNNVPCIVNTVLNGTTSIKKRN